MPQRRSRRWYWIPTPKGTHDIAAWQRRYKRMSYMEVPQDLLLAATLEGRASWVDSLPAIVEELERRWSLRVGRPFQPGGRTAWVAPARGVGNTDLVLKLAWRHKEAQHEADGLRLWSGQGAVLLHAAEEFYNTAALLLERCRPGTPLAQIPEEQHDTVVAELLHRLWREPPAGHPYRSLQVMCDEWAGEFEVKITRGRVDLDPRLIREGIHLFRTLPASAERSAVLCTDLHAGNVLAAHREPWLVVDPKPHVGDPTYDVLQHMLNCQERLRSHPYELIRRMAALTGLDLERTHLWLFARCVQESPDRPELAEVARRIVPA